MKKTQKKMNTLGLLSAATIVAASSAQAAIITFDPASAGGNLNSNGVWIGGVEPDPGDDAIVNTDAILVNANGQSWADADSYTYGGGATIRVGNTAARATGSTPTNLTGTNNHGDYVHTSVGMSVFNDATLLTNDDIFSNNSLLIFNAGSTAISGDDFESNGGGTPTINGGTHTAGDQFGAQRISTLNFLGGTVTANGFRTTAATITQSPGGTINIGGDATLDANSAVFDPTGIVDFSSSWTGQLDVAGLSTLPDWFTALDNGTLTFDGATLDEATFNDNFEVTGGALSLAVPEPSSLSLLGLSALFLARRRSRK